jgi:hypothetical protein
MARIFTFRVWKRANERRSAYGSKRFRYSIGASIREVKMCDIAVPANEERQLMIKTKTCQR